MDVLELGRNLLIGDSSFGRGSLQRAGLWVCPASKRSINNDFAKAFETTRPRSHAKDR